MATFNLYIGANNQTGLVEFDKLKTALDERYDGYTIVQSEGVWKGQHERSVVVTLQDEESTLIEAIHDLKHVLNQDAIAYQEVAELVFA